MGASDDALGRLLKAWQNPELPWPQRRSIGEQILKSIGPDRWFREFPKDLDSNFEAQLYRLNKGLQYRLTDDVKNRLLAMQLPQAATRTRPPTPLRSQFSCVTPKVFVPSWQDPQC